VPSAKTLVKRKYAHPQTPSTG